MRALITGVAGFAGSHLAEFLLKEGYEVYGADIWRSRTENIKHLEGKINFSECDINDAFSMEELLKRSKPDHIYFLAGQSSVAASWNSPAETMSTNAISQINIFEVIRSSGQSPVIHIPGSSEEYGAIKKEELPVKEGNELRPLSTYAVSKIAQDLLGYQYFKSYGLKVIRTRAFNHTGPRHADIFMTSNFAKQIALIERGKQEPVMKVGNLNAARDISDVRDMIRAYYLAVTEGEYGEVYNICSGRSSKIEDILSILTSMSRSVISVEQDPSRMRPSDIEDIFGDHGKISRRTGWEPQISLERTLEDLLNYWRERV